MSFLEFVLTATFLAAYFALPVTVLVVAIVSRQLAVENAAGRHHCGRLRAARRRAESAYRTARRIGARQWRRLTVTPSPLPLTPDPHVHGLAGVQ